MKGIVGISAIVLACVLALGSPPAAADDGTFARGYPQSAWPTTADISRTSQLASKTMQDMLRELFRTAEGTYQSGCLSSGFLCAAGTGFNVNVGAGTCFLNYTTGADAEHSAYRVLQLPAAEAATDWDANPGAGTYYVHVAYGEETTGGVEAPDPAYTIDANASLAGTYTVCSIVVTGAELSAATYTINDLRTVLNGTHYAPTAHAVVASTLSLGGTAIGATGAELNAAADLSAGGGLYRMAKVTVDAADERTAGAHAIATLPAKAIVVDVFATLSAGEASGTATVDIGPAGSADGFANDLAVSSAGYKRPQAALDGGSAYWDTNTRGALLARFVQGAGADDRGLYQELFDGTSSTKVVSYTVPGGGWTELTGDLVVVYIERP